MSNVVPHTLGSLEVDPTDAVVMPPAEVWLANFARDVRISSTWPTKIAKAGTLAEERKSLAGRPLRGQQAELIALQKYDTFRFHATLHRYGRSRSLVPLYPDVSKVTGVSTGHAPNNRWIQCSTVDRRFFVGAYVLVVRGIRNEARHVTYNLSTIVSITPTEIQCAATVAGDTFTVGDRVYPLIESRILESQPFTPQAGHVKSAELEWLEDAGQSQLLATQQPNSLPDGFPTVNGIPVLSIRPDLPDMEGEIVREGEHEEVGRGSTASFYGARAFQRRGISWDLKSRATIFKLIRFWDSRAGEAFTFYLPTWMNDFALTEVNLSTIKVTANGPFNDWDFIPAICLVLRDGSVLVRGITNVSRASGVDTITFNLDIPATPIGTVSYASAALLARFDSNELVEEWRHGSECVLSTAVVELLEEKDVEVGPITRLSAITTPLHAIANMEGWWNPGYGRRRRGLETVWGDIGDGATISEEPPEPVWNTEEAANSGPMGWRTAIRSWLDVSGNARHCINTNIGGGGSLTCYQGPDQLGVEDVLHLPPYVGKAWLRPYERSRGKQFFVMTSSPAWIEGQTFRFAQTPWPLLSSSGLTWFAIGGSLRPLTGSLFKTTAMEILRYRDGGGTETVLWRNDRLRIGGTTVSFSLTSPGDDWAFDIWCCRWNPGVKIELWKNGISRAVSTSSIPAALPTLTDLSFFTGTSTKVSSAGPLFSRPLTVGEMNTVGNFLDNKFDMQGRWTDIVGV